MKAVDLPRQPFVGLALAAAIGVALADFFPVSPTHWMLGATLFVVLGSATFFWPKVGSTYALVGFGFFLLHLFQTQDTPGLRLTAELANVRARSMSSASSSMNQSSARIDSRRFCLNSNPPSSKEEAVQLPRRSTFDGAARRHLAMNYNFLGSQNRFRRHEIRASLTCVRISRDSMFIAGCLFVMRKMAA
jgi:hypothetical protein